VLGINCYPEVYYSLELIVGENLGVVSVLSFSKSFSATFFCRLGYFGKNNTNILATKIVDSLRNKSNYEEYVIKKKTTSKQASVKTLFLI